MDYDLEGELVHPERPRVAWACPACRRVVVEGPDDAKAADRACAGDPVTGAAHALEVMTRTPPAGEESPPVSALARVIPFRRRDDEADQGLASTWRRAIPAAAWRVMDLDRLGEILRAPLPANYCATCGPLVEVDNPARREVRHRRGCPTQEA